MPNRAPGLRDLVGVGGSYAKSDLKGFIWAIVGALGGAHSQNMAPPEQAVESRFDTLHSTRRQGRRKCLIAWL